MDRKIYVVGGSENYACWMKGTVVRNMDLADLVVFTGGSDITPWHYSRRAHPRTTPSYTRDMEEIAEFKLAAEKGKHMIGICRGAQLLCAMSGGVLVQDQDNPKPYHAIDTFDGKKITVNSIHHQAMYPWLLGKDLYKVLGWSHGVSTYHDGEKKGDEIVLGLAPEDKEVEVAYFTEFKALCIQCHPEMMWYRQDNPGIKEAIVWLQGMLDMHLNNFGPFSS